MSSSLTTLPSATQTITYDGLGRPLSISESGKSALFSYDVDGNRCQMSLYNGSTLLLTRYYSGDRLEEDVTSSGTTARFYVGGDAYTAPAVYVYNGISWSLHYIGRDHLGSITLVTSSNGTKEYEYSYDAWGRLRYVSASRTAAVTRSTASSAPRRRPAAGSSRQSWAALLCSSPLMPPTP